MEIDLILEPDLTPSQITEIGIKAEEFGIRAIWTSNYFAHWDAFLSLAPLALATKKILMGPLAVSPFEMHPLKIANGLLTLNELSDGRAVAAVGAGEGNLEAMALKKPEKIVLAVREAIEIIISASNKGLTKGYDGEVFNVNLPCAYDWLKASPPKVYGTAYRQMMMRMEGRVADGCFIGCTPPEIVNPAMDAVKIGLSRRDDKPKDFRVNTFWGWHIKEDADAAYAESRRELPWRARLLDPEMIKMYLDEDEVKLVREYYDEYVTEYFDPSKPVVNIPLEVSNRLCDGLTSTGGLDSLDQEIERFKLFAAGGLTEIALRLHADPMDALKIIGEKVIPALSN
ncbi:MAG: LLM class flavin-dependent oxidoreductase [Pseudomonadota bacterium]|nr:LLM class flavin-dependent oxidoreductase [Pseudomonadota bacterium]